MLIPQVLIQSITYLNYIVAVSPSLAQRVFFPLQGDFLVLTLNHKYHKEINPHAQLLCCDSPEPNMLETSRLAWVCAE